MTEEEHCTLAASAALDEWAVRVHHDGVFDKVAIADIAALLLRERAAAVSSMMAEHVAWSREKDDAWQARLDADARCAALRAERDALKAQLPAPVETACSDCPTPDLCCSKGCHGMAWGDAVHRELTATRAELAILRDIARYAREDRAVTPGSTRLSRALARLSSLRSEVSPDTKEKP